MWRRRCGRGGPSSTGLAPGDWYILLALDKTRNHLDRLGNGFRDCDGKPLIRRTNRLRTERLPGLQARPLSGGELRQGDVDRLWTPSCRPSRPLKKKEKDSRGVLEVGLNMPEGSASGRRDR